MYDVIIIGGGIVGTATARALSRYQLKILLIEREADIAVGATKANSGILHAGYDCHPGTLKATLNVEGVAMYKMLVKELDIPCRTNGSLVISTGEDGPAKLKALYEQGLINGVTDMELLTGEEVLALEPNLNSSITGALRARTAGIISPYEAGIAFAENAAVNGVEFMLETAVIGIDADEDEGGFTVWTHCAGTTRRGGILPPESTTNADNGPGRSFASRTARPCNLGGRMPPLRTKIIINAAGVESAAIHNHVSNRKEAITPQRGQYYLLDNTQRDLIKHTVFQLPTHLGKGVLVVPTIDHNIMLGPTAEPPETPTATETTPEGLQEALEKVGLILKSVPIRDRITAFAGIRAKHDCKDFIIEETAPGFVSAIGIDSPGLSAAPAIAKRIAGFVTARLQPAVNPNFKPERVGIKRFRELPPAQQAALIKENPAYGRVVCRCETITEAEIIDAIHRPVGAKNLGAVKRRTRAQMGRCQGGFCLTKLTELLSKELNIPETAVTMDGTGSEICISS